MKKQKDVHLISKYFIYSISLQKSLFLSIEKIKGKRDQDIYEARINAPDPDCPPDHIKVDNNQRIAALQQLQYSKF
jgi:hypothetical protein